MTESCEMKGILLIFFATWWSQHVTIQEGDTSKGKVRIFQFCGGFYDLFFSYQSMEFQLNMAEKYAKNRGWISDPTGTTVQCGWQSASLFSHFRIDFINDTEIEEVNSTYPTALYSPGISSWYCIGFFLQSRVRKSLWPWLTLTNASALKSFNTPVFKWSMQLRVLN